MTYIDGPFGGGYLNCGCADPECRRYGCKLQRRQFSGGHLTAPVQRGCICPPTSEQTCQSELCPRKAVAQWDGNPKGGDGTAPSRREGSDE